MRQRGDRHRAGTMWVEEKSKRKKAGGEKKKKKNPNFIDGPKIHH